MRRIIALLTALAALSGCGAPQTPQQPQAAPSSALESSAPSSVSSEAASSTPEEQVTWGLPGSHYVDVALSMTQRFGFPEHSTKAAPEMDCSYVPLLTLTEPQTGTTFDYTIYYTAMGDPEAGAIVSATFGINNLGGLTGELFYPLAEAYLEYCALVPYGTADAATAKQWVLDNIPTAGEGENGAVTQIGDAVFSLYGTEMQEGVPGVRFLEIRKAASES